jgi:hypothetical protein
MNACSFIRDLIITEKRPLRARTLRSAQMAACLYTSARGMGSAEHAAHELRSLATELGSIVQELLRNIEASGRILRAPRGTTAGAARAHDETLRLRAAATRNRGAARRAFLSDETLSPDPPENSIVGQILQKARDARNWFDGA